MCDWRVHGIVGCMVPGGRAYCHGVFALANGVAGVGTVVCCAHCASGNGVECGDDVCVFLAGIHVLDFDTCEIEGFCCAGETKEYEGGRKK